MLMMRPAKIGPPTAENWKTPLFQVTALWKTSGSTISGTSELRLGPVNAGAQAGGKGRGGGAQMGAGGGCWGGGGWGRGEGGRGGGGNRGKREGGMGRWRVGVGAGLLQNGASDTGAGRRGDDARTDVRAARGRGQARWRMATAARR